MRGLIVLLALPLPASVPALNWQCLHGFDASLNTLVMDPVHGRIFVGGLCGYLSEIWHSVARYSRAMP